MTTAEIIWLIVGVLVFVSLFGWLFPPFFVARYMLNSLLVRTSPDKWTRECSEVNDPEQVEMYRQGALWGESHEQNRTRVFIESDGFRLVGEYFDLGFDRTVILVPGRTEGCVYSYFFAAPYEKAGFNVLAIDNRAHGLSEGKYDTLGLKEYHDLLGWARFLHEEKHQKKVLLHGLCIGSATCLYALVKDGPAPSYLMGMVADGMYASFYESLKNHLYVDKRPVYPFIWYMVLRMKWMTGVHFGKDGPIKYIGQLDRPILFIYTNKDLYSRPDQANRLFGACHAPKRLVWFEKGVHSHVRINAPERYDETIGRFVRDFLD